jgi:hypothetical protein
MWNEFRHAQFVAQIVEKNRHPTFPCYHCGADVPQNRQSCPSCGASEEDGWGHDNDHLVEDEFDYDEFLEREFDDGETLSRSGTGNRAPPTNRNRLILWAIIWVFLLSTLVPLVW